MIDIINVILALLSILVIPALVLIVSMRLQIEILRNEVLHLQKFDDSIDLKLDKIFEKLDILMNSN